MNDSFKEPFILLLHVPCSYWLAEIQLVGLHPVHVSYRGWQLSIRKPGNALYVSRKTYINFTIRIGSDCGMDVFHMIENWFAFKRQGNVNGL